LPAIRKTADAIVVADGTSCRHQIKDGTEREAIHVARLLASSLKAAQCAVPGASGSAETNVS
jgi:Fe-S oxidoreductase